MPQITKINESKGLSTNAGQITAENGYIVVNFSGPDSSDSARRLMNKPVQLRLKITDILNLINSSTQIDAQEVLDTLPVLAAGAAVSGQAYVDSTSGVVTIKP